MTALRELGFKCRMCRLPWLRVTARTVPSEPGCPFCGCGLITTTRESA